MRLLPKLFLVLGLVGVTAMAFRVSWNALRDVAWAIGADHLAAVLYPVVVDGLIALALTATLLLTDQARRFALRVLAAYVTASLVLNYDHGLVAAIQSGSRVRLADWAPANWALMLLATSLPVGSIYFGSDLVAKVLHHPGPPAPASTRPHRSTPDLPDTTPTDAPDPAPALVDPPATPTASAPPPASDPTPVVDPDRSTGPDSTVPAASRPGRARRATGAVPAAALTRAPARSFADLLDQAREVTADWSDRELSGERIRKTLRTSAANGRALRDALRRERVHHHPGLHVVEAPQHRSDQGAGTVPAAVN